MEVLPNTSDRICTNDALPQASENTVLKSMLQKVQKFPNKIDNVVRKILTTEDERENLKKRLTQLEV